MRGKKEAASSADLYWTRTEADSSGIVVASAWMQSTPRLFGKYSRIYASCNWDSLICHPQVLNLWFPNLATALAIRVLEELAMELQKRPRPVVFATFSGGVKACLYKVFKILDGSHGGVDPSLEKYKVVRDCYAGQIHDSSPVDFISEIGANYVSHPTTLGTAKRSAVLTWLAKSTGKFMDFLFLPRFEADRAEMWEILHKSGAWGPVLILFSKSDELAPFQIIESYSSHLLNLGCKVTVVMWEDSPHVGHLRSHPDDYTSSVKSFLRDVLASSNEHKLAPNSGEAISNTHSSGVDAKEFSSGLTLSVCSGDRLVLAQNIPLCRLQSRM